MGVGRFFCVALPFVLTILSLVCILVVMTGGLTNKSLEEYNINTKNFSISLSGLKDLSSDNGVLSSIISDLSENFTAKTFGLENGYQVYMWNYCYQNSTTNDTWCSKGKYNWAESTLSPQSIQGNISAASIKATGENVTVPSSIEDAFKVFATVSRWTQIVFIIALALTVLEIVVGVFGFCSRIVSCLTYLISGLSTIFTIVAAGLLTASSTIVVGAVNLSLEKYGVKSTIEGRILAIAWLAALFSISGGLFWLFSSCCCAANHPHRRARDNYEKPYTSIQQPGSGPGAAPYGGPGAQRTGGGYEPYRNV